MSIMSKVGAFFGGGAMNVVEKGADIVERWAPGAERKHEMALEIDKTIADSIESARGHAAPGETSSWWDSLANGLNRLIRPAATLGFLGGLFGLWPLPEVGAIDPIVLGWMENVIIFWFGGRVLLKDLPSAIKYLRAVR